MPRDLSFRARLRRRLRRLLLEPALYALRWIAGRLPWKVAQWIGARLGDLAWYASPRDRERSLEHLALAFPELGPDERHRVARRSFRHHGKTIFEILHAWGRSRGYICQHVTVEGFERVAELRDEGRPIVLVTGHCGNWEMMASLKLSHGFPIAAIARNLDIAQGMVEDVRRHFGTETLPRGDRRAISGMLKILRRGGALALLIDQDIDTNGVWVPFFGRLAHTPTAAADLALRLGAAAVPAFSERLENGEHRLTFHPPLDLPEDPREATALMTEAIEEQVRRRPEQWVWMHKRWRRRPPGEDDSDAASD